MAPSNVATIGFSSCPGLPRSDSRARQEKIRGPGRLPAPFLPPRQTPCRRWEPDPPRPPSSATAPQAAATAPAGTATLTSIVCERWHPIGKVGLNTVVAKIATVTLTEGTDYDVDLDAGLIRFHDTDNVDAGDNVDLTFGNVAVDFETFTGLETPTFRGDVMILETNQFSKIPLKTTTFTGVLRATEFPTQSGEFGTWKVRATATTKPSIKRRSAA